MNNNYLKLENNTQLLLDDYFLDDIWMLRRAPELPVKSFCNPVISSDPPYSPGNATVIYDKEEKIFKCWYIIFDSELYYSGQPGAYKTCYEVSADGIEWERPKLSILEYKGSKENNLVFNGSGIIYKDQYDSCLDKRYKMLYNGHRMGLCAAFSPDGINWNKYGGKDTELIRGYNDTTNGSFYDPRIKKYVRYGRPYAIAAEKEGKVLGIKPNWSHEIEFKKWEVFAKPPQNEVFPDYDDFVDYRETEDYIHRYLHQIPYVYGKTLRLFKGGNSGCNRRIIRSESEDYINWSLPELVIAPDELDPAKLYGMSVTIYEGMYIGLLQLYNSWGERRIPGSINEDETIDIQLTFSRDGKKWERLANRPVFIPRGYIGGHEGGMIFGTGIPLIEYGDELRFYYTANPECHNAICESHSSLNVARLPAGRLVSRAAGDEMGALITKPFLLEHDRVCLNIDSRKGIARVEITDIEGKPLGGFTAEESSMISENNMKAFVAWNGKPDVGALKGQIVRLRIYMQKSKLYSLQFV